MALDFDQSIYEDGYKYIAGTDEAGRGCLLGPVVAGAVILPKDFYHPLINDSKQLTEKQREEAYEIIIKHALSWSVASISPEDIDRINILNASRLAMKKAIEGLNHEFDIILTDAMKMPGENKPVVDLVHGDARSLSIAAASIVAKVTRDRACILLNDKYPEYNIAKNKGYGTKDHLEALKKYGPVKGLHRFSYGPIKKLFIEENKLF